MRLRIVVHLVEGFVFYQQLFVTVEGALTAWYRGSACKVGSCGVSVLRVV